MPEAALTTTPQRMMAAGQGRSWKALLAVLLFSELFYVALLRWNAINGVYPVLGFLGLMGGLFGLYALAFRIVRDLRDNATLVVVLLGALLFRLTMLSAGLPHDALVSDLPDLARSDLRGEAVVYERFLLYDHDLWRYLWDGHVAANGVNPYSFAPSAAALNTLADDEVWTDIRGNINYPDIPTVYPPLAQLTFRTSHALAPGSVLAFKGLLVLLDLAAVGLIALGLRWFGRPAAWAVLYAWNPLVIKAVAGSAHFESLVVVMLTATALLVAQRRKTLAALVFGLAVLARLTPIILVPFVARRIGWKRTALAAATVAAGYLPFLDAGSGLITGLAAFGREWHFNAGLYMLAERLFVPFGGNPAMAARAICALTVFGVLVYLAARDDGRRDAFAALAATALGALIVLSPTAFPWYVVWVLPLAVIAGSRLWIAFSALVCLAFVVMVEGCEYPAVLALEYGAFLFLVWRQWWSRRPGVVPRPSPQSQPFVHPQLNIRRS